MPLVVDAFASERHYLDHLAPIWQAIPRQRRGRFWLTANRELVEHARRLDVDPTPAPSPPSNHVPILVASYADEKRARRRPIVLVEHGAGQHYSAHHPSYPGGVGRDAVGLFLCNNDDVAQRNAAVYPEARVTVVGSPKLDRWHRRGAQPPDSVDVTIGVAFHWDCVVTPEARWAWPHYKQAIADLARRHHVVGHCHPRVWDVLEREYRAIGVRPLYHWERLFEEADVLAVDNSSIGIEWISATRRPLVWLNAPWYRRDVHHGGRFWEWTAAGPQVDRADDLEEVVTKALVDDGWAESREAVASSVYAHRDGTSARRAAAAVVAWLDAGAPVPQTRRNRMGNPYAPKSPRRVKGTFTQPTASDAQGAQDEPQDAGAVSTADEGAAAATGESSASVADRATGLPLDDVPDTAGDVVDWVTEPDDEEEAARRRAAAAEVELARDEGERRKTVLRAVADEVEAITGIRPD